MYINVIVILVSFIIPSVCFSSWFGPKDFDDCILRSMKGVTSDMAAKAIYKSCRDKFPEKIPDSVKLTEDQIKKITGHISGDSNYLSGNIYNGNDNIKLTQLSIKIVPDYDNAIKRIKKMSSAEKDKYKETLQIYNDNVDIDPLTSSNISLVVNKFDKTTVGFVVGAKGIVIKK